MKWKTLIFIICLLVPFSFGVSVHRSHRSNRHMHTSIHLFAASPQSVPLENVYANRMMLTRYRDNRSLRRAVEAGELVSVKIPCSPRLPKERRYLLSNTENFLETLDAEFTEQSGHHLTIDSAIRTVKVQRSILRWNRGAAPADGENASSHERGTTVDISRRLKKGEYQWLLWKLFYYREIGRVLVIEERGCIHLFVTMNPDHVFG